MLPFLPVYDRSSLNTGPVMYSVVNCRLSQRQHQHIYWSTISFSRVSLKSANHLRHQSWFSFQYNNLVKKKGFFTFSHCSHTPISVQNETPLNYIFRWKEAGRKHVFTDCAPTRLLETAMFIILHKINVLKGINQCCYSQPDKVMKQQDHVKT